MARTDEISQEIAILMPILARRILFEFFQEVDVTQTQIFTLMTLYEQAPIRLSDLSSKLKVQAPTVTGIIDRLEKSHYVRRIPDTEDRRAINVDLTDKGRKVTKKMRGIIQSKWKDILETLPAVERETYLRILKKMVEKLP